MSRRRNFAAAFSLLPVMAAGELNVVVVEGLGGESRYAEQFAEQVAAIERSAQSLTSAGSIRVFRSGEFSREEVIEHFAGLTQSMQSGDRLAIFLIGHGSYDDHEYKFNIAGPDLTDADLLDIVDGAAAVNVLLVNTSSASGATLERLRSDERTLILATRSGAERHATRFGTYFAAALTQPTADLDKNRVISAEEAFRFAERQVTDYFERNGQLATEHPRIEGSQAARFGLARLGATRTATSDAELDRLIMRRDALNTDIEELRLRRDSMTADAYQEELLDNMLELATLEEQIEQRQEALDRDN